MQEIKIKEAAEFLGVSPDTVRRLADAGAIKARRTAGGQRVLEGRSLAAYLAKRQGARADAPARGSTRNRIPGIVTRVVKDRVAAQVELQAGPHRIVCLLTREAVEALGLVPGTIAVATVKATNVAIELPAAPRAKRRR
jgi:molybdopterin-binding protein